MDGVIASVDLYDVMKQQHRNSAVHVHIGRGGIAKDQRVKRKVPAMFGAVFRTAAINQQIGAVYGFEPVRLVQESKLGGQGRCHWDDASNWALRCARRSRARASARRTRMAVLNAS